MVEPKMSNSDKLKRTLLMGKDPNMPPASEVSVTLGVKVTSVTYDAYTSKLTTGLSILRVSFWFYLVYAPLAMWLIYDDHRQRHLYRTHIQKCMEWHIR